MHSSVAIAWIQQTVDAAAMGDASAMGARDTTEGKVLLIPIL